MPKRASAFKPSDLKRALSAAKAAGADVETAEIDPVTGKIVIRLRCASLSNVNDDPYEKWRASRARQT